ncbi:MAG: C69 family dipeptidase [Fidelibacterota bacterium]|nr:MAG: C69 family dipeptidase [Candidatus Neomarinimicrobiota bacterium]
MSSTMVIAASASPDGVTHFGKNSNREPGECQLVLALPAVEYDANTLLKCTHLSITQVPQRYAIVLSKPWWCWGGEMGANDQGVVIGSEAVSTRNHEPEPGLIGMDLVRLGLERGRNAEEAMKVITSLLQTHGQGGACQLGDSSFSDDNSFIIADANEAWILETAGRHWAAKRVLGTAVLSSELTLATDFDRSSYALPQYARLKGWVRKEEGLNFAEAFGRTPHRHPFGKSHPRRTALLESLPRLDRDHPHLGMMQLLRQRKKSHPRRWSKEDVALHARGTSRWLQTTGSMVAMVSKRRQDFFFTGTSAPDLSIFKPVHFDLPLEDDLKEEDLSRYHDHSLWWRHEKLHRTILLTPHLDDDFIKERDDLEREMVQDLAAGKGRQLLQTRRKIRNSLLKWEETWIEKAALKRSFFLSMGLFSRYWLQRNRLDGVTLNLT